MAAQNKFSAFHTPVLYKETLELLNIKPDGRYVDCTFGGGGHSKGILSALGKKGKLIAFDQDKDAQKNLLQDERFIFIPENFRHIQRFLRLHDVLPVDGILADLGVSSFQFDTGERGFSTRFNGPLDMRMNTSQHKTAAHILMEYDERSMHKMFEKYGEVSNAKTLAGHIVKTRKTMQLKTIDAFKLMLQPVMMGNPNKYLAQVFQALRIEVNEELIALEEMLEQLPAIMKKNARCAIISFHSMEDRLVKNFFKNAGMDTENENPFGREIKEPIFKLITKKPVMASKEEINMNPRSRSAKLRVAEKK